MLLLLLLLMGWDSSPASPRRAEETIEWKPDAASPVESENCEWQMQLFRMSALRPNADVGG